MRGRVDGNENENTPRVTRSLFNGLLSGHCLRFCLAKKNSPFQKEGEFLGRLFQHRRLGFQQYQALPEKCPQSFFEYFFTHAYASIHVFGQAFVA